MSSFDFTDFSIETERMMLVPLSLKYKHEIFREFTPLICQYMVPKPPDDISETENFINTSVPNMKTGDDMKLVMTLKETNEFIGLVRLHEAKSPTPIMGLWVKKSAHGNAYGKESIFAIYKWAKENINFDYLKYNVDKDNIPSIKIPEALGGKVAEIKSRKGLAGNPLNLLEYHIY